MRTSMKLRFFIITIIFSTFLFGRNDVDKLNTFSPKLHQIKDSTSQDLTANENKKFIEEKRLWWEAGINVSGLQNIGSEKRFGYLIGLTISHKLSNLIDIDISGLVSRQNLFLKNIKSTGSDGQFVYRIIHNYKISILFLELPVMINYKLWDNNFYSFYAGFGLGYSISSKDYSERTDFVNTGEILNIGIPVDEHYIEDSVFDNSGIHINSGIRFNYNKFMIKLLYVNKRYDLKRIDKEHTFSLHFGYNLD